MKSVQKIDLGLTGYDELFMNDAERKENKLPRIYDIPLSEIDDFPDHPFKVKLDEDMDQLVQSIKERGIITPVTLRPKEDGRYEIVSGHRRRKACELAGFDTVKAEVREMTRDEAIILMVESNLQRSVILPSEKAFSYKMRLEAMNRQGQRTDLTCDPVGHKLQGMKSVEIVAESSPDSKTQVQRYIRLTELMDLVDEGRIAFRPAVELSYLQKEEQGALLEQIAYADATPSLAQAIKLKRFSQDGKLNNEVIESIMSEEKPNQREKINIKYAEARRFIPASIPYEKTGEYIFLLANEGKSPRAIAELLTKEKILIPAAHAKEYHPEQYNGAKFSDPYTWGMSTIRAILSRQEYLGHTVLRKSVSTNFKLHKRKNTDEDEQYVFYNTHEPIISQELWDSVQKRKKRANRTAAKGTHSNRLSGYLYCADCGRRMTLQTHYSKKDRSVQYSYRCGGYASKVNSCSAHSISADNVEALILSAVKRLSRFEPALCSGGSNSEGVSAENQIVGAAH